MNAGAKFIQNTAGSPHILGFSAAETTSDQEIFEIWNGSTAAARVFRMNKDGSNQAADGTKTNPSYAWETDKDSGFYLIGAANVGLSLGDTKIIDFGATTVQFTAADLEVANGQGLRVGHTAMLATADASLGDGTAVTAELQVAGTGTADSTAVLIRHSADAVAAGLTFSKSRNAALGSFTVVQDNDYLGHIAFAADDGTDSNTTAARISGRVDDAAPTTSSIGGQLIFAVAAGSATDDLAEAFRLDANLTATFAGALTVNGDSTLNGDVTLASAKNITIPGAILGDTATGYIRAFGDSGTSIGWYLFDTGLMTLNDTSNANMDVGFTVNQGAAINQAMCLKSNTTHGLTTGTLNQDVETDDFLTISKWSGALGGAFIQAVAKDDALDAVLSFEAYGGTAPTTDTTTSQALVTFFAAEHDGANALVNAPADANLFAIQSYSSGARTTRLLVKGDDGELHIGNTTLVALDTEDDVGAVRALQRIRTGGAGIVETDYEKPDYSYEALRDLGVVGEKDANGEFMIRVQPYLNLHDGALWQLHVRNEQLRGVLATLVRDNNLTAAPDVKALLEA